MAHDPTQMITELANFLRKGFDTIIIHVEALECQKAAHQICASGLLLGIALKAETDITALDPYKNDLSTVLVFTVLSIGQRVYPEAYNRLSTIKQYLIDNKINASIVADGGVYEEDIGKLAVAGATDFVIGSAFFGRDGKGNSKDLLESLEKQIEVFTKKKL